MKHLWITENSSLCSSPHLPLSRPIPLAQINTLETIVKHQRATPEAGGQENSAVPQPFMGTYITKSSEGSHRSFSAERQEAEVAVKGQGC